MCSWINKRQWNVGRHSTSNSNHFLPWNALKAIDALTRSSNRMREWYRRQTPDHGVREMSRWCTVFRWLCCHVIEASLHTRQHTKLCRVIPQQWCWTKKCTSFGNEFVVNWRANFALAPLMVSMCQCLSVYMYNAANIHWKNKRTRESKETPLLGFSLYHRRLWVWLHTVSNCKSDLGEGIDQFPWSYPVLSLDDSNYPFPEQKCWDWILNIKQRFKGRQPKSRHNILTSTITTPSLIRFVPWKNPVANGVGELRMGGLPHQGTSMDTCGHMDFPSLAPEGKTQ